MFQAPIYTKEQLTQLNENEIQYPYSDEYMVYDGLKHQYQLTRKAFEEDGINLMEKIEGATPDKINAFLHALRVKVYTTIYNRNKSTRNQLNYMIAKRGLLTMSMAEYRETFFEAMKLEGEYLLENGDLSFISGVDLDTMQNMSADVMRSQNRDWHKDALLQLQVLGLNYAKRYSFYPQGKDINW